VGGGSAAEVAEVQLLLEEALQQVSVQRQAPALHQCAYHLTGGGAAPQFAGQFTTAYVCTGGSDCRWPPQLVAYSVILVLAGQLAVKGPSKTHHISQGMFLLLPLRSKASTEMRLHAGTKLLICGICADVVRQQCFSAAARSHMQAVSQARPAVLETRQKVAKARFKRKSCKLTDRAVQDGLGHNKRLRAKQQPPAKHS